MKRLLLALTLIAAGFALSAVTLPDGNFPTPTLPFIEAPLHAQAPGWQTWQNMHGVRLTADCTDGGGVTTLQNPCANVTTNTGPQVTFNANSIAQAYQLDCAWHFSQATVVADSIGVQFGTSPTSAQLGGFMFTNTTALASIAAPTITNTTATAVITGTPAVTTVLYAHMDGLIEIPASGQDTIMTILVSQATAANVIVSKRGSVCRWWAVQ